MATDLGWELHTWRRIANELGLTTLMIPEEFGGAGFGLVEVGVAMEAAGRTLLCAPLLSHAIGTAGLLLCNRDTQERWLPRIATGQALVTAVVPRLSDDLRVSGASGKVRLHGSAGFVLDGHAADVAVLIADSSAGRRLVAVELDGAGVRRERLSTLDQTRRLAHLRFDNAPVSDEGPGRQASGRLVSVAAVLLAMEQVGGCAQLLDNTLDYVKTRNQFSRSIGSFQVIKHRCADLFIELETGMATARAALIAVAADSSDAPELAHIAQVYCSEAFLHCASDSLQLHGGIGFTWEHSSHLYLKRAKSVARLFGDPAEHRAALAELMKW
jgi:alkylation response protein AidB-like acyl-CoA dehydrogenase